MLTGDDDAPGAVGVQPVLDRPADQRRIGNDQDAAVESFDLGRARVDAAHESLFGADDDPVADADAPLPQQDQAGDEIIGDRLQAEADADRQRAGDDRQLLRIEAELGAAEQQRDEDADIADDRARSNC